MFIKYYDANGLVKNLGDIEHFNHNHDALGRFAKGNGSSKTQKAMAKSQKKIKKNEVEFTRQYADKYARERMKLRNRKRSDSDIREIALNSVVNKNIRKSNKNVEKYLNKYYNKGFDPSNEKDRIEMGNYYLNIKLSQINIERANQLNKSLNGRGDLAKGYYTNDPLDSRTKIPQAWEYRSNKDVRKRQKKK